MPITAENASGVIRVKVTGVRYAQGGNLVLTLYNSEDSWFVLEKIYAYKIVKVTGDTLTVDFDNIPYADTYALFVFHDANGNNMLDFSWFPFPHPKEGVAVSNNAVRMGEPYYSKARFSINSNECLMEIKMHY
ncbi:MAG: DUF2141 domain-containing protein [Candidatus Omnitrophota bacterium]